REKRLYTHTTQTHTHTFILSSLFIEASLINKPLVLSLPKRSPHSSATFLVSSKKDMNLPIMFQVPDVLSKARRNQGDPMLIRNKQLCSMCREIKTVGQGDIRDGMGIPGRSTAFSPPRMMSLHPPKAQTVRKPSRGDIPTESVHYRLPILGPRTAVFHGMLSDAYKTLQETHLSSLSGKEPMGKTMRQRVIRTHNLADSERKQPPQASF
uniref:Chromosome 1 open reading frame 105 n=1 Tax=Equus asinus asinus TaxID=83772 RepID=A0A8C4MDX7_EQUAS